MKHFSNKKAKQSALMTSAAIVMIGLTSSAAFAAPTVSGTKGCIVNYNSSASSHSSSDGGGSGDGGGGGGDYSYNNAATCREDKQWPGGRGQPRTDAFTVGNFVSAEEVNNVISQVVTIIDQKTTGDGGAKDREQDGRLDGHDNKITDINTSITNIKTDVTNIKTDVTNIKNTVDDHEKRITTNENNISGLKESAVKYVLDANGKATNKVLLTGDGSGEPVAISNLKAGVEDTDAVNYGQVKDNLSYDKNADGSRGNSITLQGGKAAPVVIHNVADGQQDSDAATVRQVKKSTTESKEYTDHQISILRENNNDKYAALNDEISSVRKEARAGISSAMAAASLRYDDRQGKGSVAMGMGGFKNATSIAAGVGYTSEDGKWRVNSAVAHSFSGSATSWNAGVSWTFN